MAMARGLVQGVNTRWHEVALWGFTAVVVAHWAEHLVQAFQVFVLGWTRPESRGVLGQFMPWLVKSESLHYAYAIGMLAFLILLAPGFRGRAKFFWMLALGIQFWHHLEHLFLLYQRQTGDFWFGEAIPTSVLQNFVMRVELHLFYNAIVFLPMLIAVLLHMFPPDGEEDDQTGPTCTCNKKSHRVRHTLTPAQA